MVTNNPIFEYEEDPFHEPSYYINNDLHLLLLLVFLESHKTSKEVLCFADFLKGDFWDNGEIVAEVMDTNNYYAVTDMVLEQIVFMFEDLRMGKVLEDYKGGL